MTVAIYARVSTEEQAKNGFSLRDQVRRCRDTSGTEEVIEYVDDGVSGEFLNRPALNRLRRDIKSGIIKMVICLDPDRLSRSLNNLLLITDEIERRAELIFISGEYAKTPEGTLFFQIKGAFAEFEKTKITERFMNGRREKAEQGKVVRDYQIYGYRYDKQTNQLVINEEEVKTVKLMFDLFTAKDKKVDGLKIEGINGIARYLTQQGIPTKKGGKVWHRQVVRQILMNPVYTGVFHQNRWNCEGMLGNKFRDNEDRVPMKERPKEEWIAVPCPSIIDEMQFQHAQRILEQSRRLWAGGSKYNYLLSGLVRCGECGNTMVGRNHKNWGKHIREYSDQKNTAGAKFKGCGMRVTCEKLDEMVWNTVLEWLKAPEAIDEVAATSDNSVNDSFEEAELQRIERELEKIKNGRKKLIKAYTADLIEQEDFEQEVKEFNAKEERLKKEQAELIERLNAKESDKYRENILKEACEQFLSKPPEEFTHEEKQDLIRYVVREVRVYKDEVKVFGY